MLSKSVKELTLKEKLICKSKTLKKDIEEGKLLNSDEVELKSDRNL